jgi:hypothetical protein
LEIFLRNTKQEGQKLQPAPISFSNKTT